MDLTLDEFAAAVGSIDPVTIDGLATRGGGVADVRSVSAPVGIERIDAAEMVVECGAGTPVADVLEALAEAGQTVAIPTGGTIGGALAVGRSDVSRLGSGPVRDVLLQTHFVSASGKLTKGGGPTVKNVSGFDLCRLLVGSHGTLGFFGDVILRTRPLPRSTAWFTSDLDPFELLKTLYRPVALLWNGETTWIRLDGDEGDTARTVARHDLAGVQGPPTLPGPHRWSVPPGELPDLRDAAPGSFVAEIGVGVVHHTVARVRPTPLLAVRRLHDRIKTEFDPLSRLNPGVDPLTARSSP